MWSRIQFLIRVLLGSERFRRDVDDEIRFHLEARAEDLERQGLTRRAALRRARVEFGSIPHSVEASKESHGLRLFSELGQDLRHSARLFRRSPGFAVVAIVTLALGIGSSIAVFSVLNAILLRPFEAPGAGRIVVFGTAREGQGPTGMAGGSPTRFNAWRELDDVIEDVSAYRRTKLSLTGLDSPRQIEAAQVSEAYFRLFGVQAIRGRMFGAKEDQHNAGGFAVVSEPFWRTVLSADPSAVGVTLNLGGLPHKVIGIAARVVDPGSPQPDVWIPFQIDPASRDQSHFFRVAGRIKSGVSRAQVETRLGQASDEFAAKYPKIGARLGGSRFVVRPITEVFDPGLKDSLFVLLGAVSLVMLIACANVAGLLLARGVVRQREFALRSGLGAGRSRLVRQLLTESAALWVSGGVLGLAAGVVGSRVVAALSPFDIPRLGANGSAINADWRVVTFAVFVSLATAVVFGLYPALRSSRFDLSSTIGVSKRLEKSGSGRGGARSAFVVAQIALAMTLVVACGLLIRTFAAMRSADPGFAVENVLTIQAPLDDERYRTTSGLASVVRESVGRIESIPGVVSVAAGCCLPTGGVANGSFSIVGQAAESTRPRANMPTVSANYFSTVGIPLIQGRTITDADDERSRKVAVVNSSLANQHWSAGRALGTQLAIGPEDSPDVFEVVGVVGDVRYREDGKTAPTIYLPLTQMPDGATKYYVRQPTSWILRTQGPPYSVASAAKDEIQESTGLPAVSIRSMENVLTESTARSDFSVGLMLVFGALALVLAAVGVFGVVNYHVQRRRSELGVRLALGAEKGQVRRLVLLQSARLSATGVTLGFAMSFACADLLSSLLVGVDPHDSVVFLCSAIVLVVIAAFASWVPAVRASALDPAVALRHD